MWDSEISLLWENLYHRIIFQFLCHPANKYGIWLYHKNSPPTISLWLLLWFWLHNIFFGWFQSFFVGGYSVVQASLGGSAGKESACNMEDLGSIPGLGRSPGEGKGYPLQYSGLENSVDCTVHGVANSQTWLSDFHFHWAVSCDFDVLWDEVSSSPSTVPSCPCPFYHTLKSFAELLAFTSFILSKTENICISLILTLCIWMYSMIFPCFCFIYFETQFCSLKRSW